MIKIKLILLLFALYCFAPVSGQISNDSLVIETCKENTYQVLVKEFGKLLVDKHFIFEGGVVNHNYRYLDTLCLRTVAFTIKMYESSKDSVFYSFHPSCDCKGKDDKLKKNFYKKVLKPQIKLLKGKLISLNEAIAIAKKYNYEKITTYNLDYFKNKIKQKYTHKIVWTLMQESRPGVYDVIVINAKNGKIVSRHSAFRID